MRHVFKRQNDFNIAAPTEPFMPAPFLDHSERIRFLSTGGMSERRLIEIYGRQAVTSALRLP